MVLCGRCAGIDFGSLIERACTEADLEPTDLGFFPNPPVIVNLSLAALKEAATQGCDLCSLIHHGLLDRTNTRPIHEDLNFGNLELDTILVVSIELERCHQELAPIQAQCSALKVQCHTGVNEIDEAWNWIWLTLATETTSQYVPGKRVAWNPSLWHSWIDDCIKTHETCDSSKHDGYAPTRLVDIGLIDTPPKLVVLCERYVEYVALSHCWGGSLPLRTTTANLQDHLGAIPWDALPATFQDAVKITRSLGYQYLWIDCLCIVQDSEEDWLHECALMGEVYAGAAMTIAAEQSSSPSDGIFGVLDQPNHTCTIPVQWPSTGNSGNLTIGLPPSVRMRHSRSFLYGPLSRRGWILQERVLSRRVLHISGDATGFICSCSESIDSIRWPMPLNDSHFRLTLPHVHDVARLLIDWYMLVLDYSGRHLTNARDRLPAISGVARILSERFNWTYVAGLWSHDLEAALLWWVLEPDESFATNPVHYNGPSWSWASVNRRINYSPPPVFGKRYPRSWIQDRNSPLRFQEREWASHYQVRHFSVELAGDDAFAEVKAGQITIFGNIRPIPRPAVPDPSWQPQSFIYQPGSTVDVEYKPDQIESPAELATNGAEIRCLLVGFSRYHNADNILPTCYALVLQAVPGSNDTFRRIGMMIFVRRENNADRWDEVVDWLLAAEAKEIYLV